MSHLIIRIGEIDSPTLFPEIQPKMNGRLHGVGILEAGMVSGKVSLAMLIETPQGFVFTELSADMLKMIASAVNGAEERFARKRN